MNYKSLFLLPTTLFFLTACGSDPAAPVSPPPAVSESGTTNTDITDAASDSFSQVWVDISKITATHQTTGKIEDLTYTSSQGSFNLLSLRDLSERLATKVLPEGEYSNIRVELTPGSDVVVFDLQGNKKDVSLSSNILVMDSTFTVIKDTSTTLLIDFDVDQWEVALKQQVEGVKMDVAKLPLKKSIEIKSVKVKASGVLEKINSEYFLDLPTEKTKHRLVFDSNTDMTDFDLNIGKVYEVEGLLTNAKLAVDEMELQTDNEIEDTKVIAKKIKIYGIVEFVNTDDDGVITSVQVRVDRTSKMLNTMSVNVILNGSEDVKYVNAIDSTSLEAGVKVKVKGELLSASLEDITAYTIIIKSGEIKPIEVREKFKSVEKIKCASIDVDAATVSCEIHKLSKNYYTPSTTDATTVTTALVIDLDRLEINGSTKNCFETGRFIDVKVEGRLSVDKTKVFVKELESEQRCVEKTSLISGFLANYNDATCSSLNNDDAIVRLTGKMSVVSYTNTDAITTLLAEEEVVLKIRSSNGSLKIKAESRESKEAVYNFLSLPESSDNPAIVSVGNTVYVYSSLEKIGGIPSSELTITSIGGYVKIDNVIGESVIVKPLDEDEHRKAVSCDFQLVDEDDTNIGTIKTNEKTRWLGKSYKFENSREVNAVIDVNSVAQSIKFGKLKNPDDEKETLEELQKEDMSKKDSETEEENALRKEEYQQKLKDALDDALKGGLPDDKLGDKQHKDEETKEEKELEYKEKISKEDDKKKLKSFDYGDFVDEIERYTKDLYKKVERADDVSTKADVIAEFYDELESLTKKITEKLESYSLPSPVSAEIQELIDSLADVSKLYDVFDKHDNFFEADDEEKYTDGDDSSRAEDATVTGEIIKINGISYEVNFSNQTITGDHHSFTGWDVRKIDSTDQSNAKYYLELKGKISAKTNIFELPHTNNDVIINEIVVKSDELGTKSYDLTSLNVQRLDIGIEDDFKDDFHFIDIEITNGVDSEINYYYDLDGGMIEIFNNRDAEIANLTIYNFDFNLSSDADADVEFYTDLTYKNKYTSMDDDQTIDINVRIKRQKTPKDSSGKVLVLEDISTIHGVASINGKKYELTGNEHHIIMERKMDDGTIDRIVSKGSNHKYPFASVLNEDGMRDTNYDGTANLQFMLNDVPLANWSWGEASSLDCVNCGYLVKKYGHNTVMLKYTDTTGINPNLNPTNFFLNGVEYPLVDVVLSLIEEDADLMNVSPYSKKKIVQFTGDEFAKLVHQATSLEIKFGRDRLRYITDSVEPKDKVSIIPPVFTMAEQLIQVRNMAVITKAQASINEYGIDYTNGNTDTLIKYEVWLDASSLSSLDTNATEILGYQFNMEFDSAQVGKFNFPTIAGTRIGFNSGNKANSDITFNSESGSLAFASATAVVDNDPTNNTHPYLIGAEKLIGTFYVNPIDAKGTSVDITISSMLVVTDMSNNIEQKFYIFSDVAPEVKANPDSVQMDEDSTIIIDVLANDTGSGITIFSAQADYGSVQIVQ